ncbi:MAG: response regulator [Desulfobacteraceae bacterium]|nr:response regulator [Desulfobacteraceae bacterium]
MMTYGIETIENKAPPLITGGLETHLPKQKEQDSQPLRSLVVDDDGIVLKYVAQMLSRLGCPKVETAQKKPELLNKLVTGPFDLMVTDLEMPDMNGFHLSQMIKNEMGNTKVIIMTGRGKEDCLDMMATRWVDGWLFKPFGLKELRHMLQWLGLLKD